MALQAPAPSSAHDPVLRYAILGLLAIAVVVVLTIARPVAVPVAAGLIAGLVLGPAADWLTRHGLHQAVAAGLITLAGCLGLVALFALLAAPVALGAGELPAITTALRAKFDRVLDLFVQLWVVAGVPVAMPEMAPAVRDAFNPLVNIAVTSTSVAGGLLIFVATVYFYLATHRNMKAGLLRLCFDREIRQVTDAFFDKLERRIARYFTLVTSINLGVGVITALIALVAGLPYPAFWAALAFTLNYLPFIGPFIATVLLLGAGLAAKAGFVEAIWPAAVFFLVHLIEGNLLTPSLIGRRLTMPPFLVFLSFVVLLWLWGPAGAMLSTPLLIVAMISAEMLAIYRRKAVRRSEQRLAASTGRKWRERERVATASVESTDERRSAMDKPSETTMRDNIADLAGAANQQLKAAGVDTDVMASRAGELQKMVRDEIAARPFQALGVAAFLGFLCGLRR
ncbi:AI-2 transport protein TqsA [bacterium YEK0313]|nr:AI-2 transport protein TqsA [bacterium YEK0313]